MVDLLFLENLCLLGSWALCHPDFSSWTAPVLFVFALSTPRSSWSPKDCPLPSFLFPLILGCFCHAQGFKSMYSCARLANLRLSLQLLSKVPTLIFQMPSGYHVNTSDSKCTINPSQVLLLIFIICTCTPLITQTQNLVVTLHPRPLFHSPTCNYLWHLISFNSWVFLASVSSFNLP